MAEKNNNTKMIYNVLIVVVLLGTLFSYVKDMNKASAQISIKTPFSGQISSSELCCNGIKFNITSKSQGAQATGTFLMSFVNMIPIPDAGIGLYSWWAILANNNALGDAIQGGTCLTISSECESSESVNWSAQEMGTSLTSSGI